MSERSDRCDAFAENDTHTGTSLVTYGIDRAEYKIGAPRRNIARRFYRFRCSAESEISETDVAWFVRMIELESFVQFTRTFGTRINRFIENEQENWNHFIREELYNWVRFGAIY